MNRLEQYISDNRGALDEQPPAGHWERFLQKKQRQHRNIILWRWTSGIAASVAILITTGLFWQKPSIDTNTAMLCEDSADMKYCYVEKMEIVANQIEVLIKDYDAWDRQEVMDNVQEIIAATQGTDLEDALPPELSAAEHKAILADYYQHNLSSMEGIVYSLLN